MSGQVINPVSSKDIQTTSLRVLQDFSTASTSYVDATNMTLTLSGLNSGKIYNIFYIMQIENPSSNSTTYYNDMVLNIDGNIQDGSALFYCHCAVKLVNYDAVGYMANQLLFATKENVTATTTTTLKLQLATSNALANARVRGYHTICIIAIED